ncbi:rod shape-determining protein MreD [Cruoricaptor ignavus]|uniref:Rod shape-determining protein MreD n=1 Tax=Cruoricaptor ignavus TaxID=1118202 RepID=A0A7M1T2C1_9FLAO|nr:rod shape-determining protein MreD [Cruoricaptor ignavus]QOR73092.1 rod shape-determining protein MreD [Cruoricaptor ignavus]
MISKTLYSDIIQIVVLVALQIFVLNRVTLFGRYTPVMYPMFVMFWPFFRNRYQFLVLSFLLGLSIDAFLGTWGINAFATTALAYFRTLIFRTSTDTESDFFSFQSLQWPQFLFFIFSSIFLHQFLVQFMEFFKLSRVLEILLNILITSTISFFCILLYALAFKIKQKV